MLVMFVLVVGAWWYLHTIHGKGTFTYIWHNASSKSRQTRPVLWILSVVLSGSFRMMINHHLYINTWWNSWQPTNVKNSGRLDFWREKMKKGSVQIFLRYGWWKKSCTTWVVSNPINNEINCQPQLVDGRISEPSTVVRDYEAHQDTYNTWMSQEVSKWLVSGL